MKSWRLFRIAGIDINVHWSFLGLVLLIAVSFGMQHPSEYMLGVLAAVLLVGCVFIHELSHALVAKFAYRHPVPSITFFGLGGATAIGDSKGGHDLRGELVFTLAGPVASFLLAGMFYFISLAFGGVHARVSITAGYLAFVNVALGIFNMLPIFPMDGGRALRSIIYAATHDFLRATRFTVSMGRGVIIMGMVAAFIYLPPLNFLWLGFIAFFIWNGASAEESAVERKIDEEYMRKYIGKESKRSREPFVRMAGGGERDMWGLVPYCLDFSRREAVEKLTAEFSMSREEAEAAWLFCKRHDALSMFLFNSHTGILQSKLTEGIAWWNNEGAD